MAHISVSLTIYPSLINIFLFLLPFIFLRLKPANIIFIHFYIWRSSSKKANLTSKGLGASLASSGLEPTFPLNFGHFNFGDRPRPKLPHDIPREYRATTIVLQKTNVRRHCATTTVLP